MHLGVYLIEQPGFLLFSYKCYVPGPLSLLQGDRVSLAGTAWSKMANSWGAKYELRWVPQGRRRRSGRAWASSCGVSPQRRAWHHRGGLTADPPC